MATEHSRDKLCLRFMLPPTTGFLPTHFLITKLRVHVFLRPIRAACHKPRQTINNTN